MTREAPAPMLCKITCLGADNQNRPQCIANEGSFRTENQKILTSPQPFDTIWRALRTNARHVFLIDEDIHIPWKSIYLIANDDDRDTLRMILDRHFEIPTVTCIAIEEFIPHGGEVIIG